MSAAAAVKPLVRCTLEVLKGPHLGEKFDFEKVSFTVGREGENDITLSKDPRVSRQHAQIKQDNGQFQIVNLSQRNFILVNGIRVTQETLTSKAIVQIGETEFKFFIHDNTGSLEPVSPAQSDKTNVAPLRSVQANYAAPPAATASSSVAAAGPHSPAMPQPRVAQQWTQQQPRTNHYQARPAESNGRIRLYSIVGVFLLIVGFVVMKGGRTQRAPEKPFRTTEEMDVDRQQTENEINSFKERQKHMQTTVYQKAYENFLRGYRDYRQGQYSRSLDAFQVVLNLDPGNELALRYYNLAKIKFDEIVKFNMLQGHRYLENQNYRMCKSHFQTVMTMLGSTPSSPEYVEAKQLHERCASAMEGLF